MTALQDQLDEITQKTRSLVTAERMQVSEQSVGELFASGIEGRILPVGARAPEFALANEQGKLVRSADMLALGPLVIKFFRGRWCPYCVTELEAWRELYPKVREAGALMIAISPQSSRQSDFMAGQHRLPFALLSDPGCRVAGGFGVGYEVPEFMREYYRSILVNIPFIHGQENGSEESWRLPLPGTFVVGRDGQIVYSEAHADFRVRPEPEEALEQVLAARF